MTDATWHALMPSNPRHRLRRQLADVPYRFEAHNHGLTRGKLYEPRGDCADCQNEMIERQRLGGVQIERL